MGLLISDFGRRCPDTGQRSRCQSIGERIEGYDDERTVRSSPHDRSGEQAEAEGMEREEEVSMNEKTRKVLDINVEGINFICIFAVHAQRNPYRLFRRWHDSTGWHRQKVEYYGNFVSVLCYLRDFAFSNEWGFKDYFN